MVQNGTLSHVILDCVYGLNHSEKDGMILKWYFNGKIIFQWIPPLKPKVRTKNIASVFMNTDDFSSAVFHPFWPFHTLYSTRKICL